MVKLGRYRVILSWEYKSDELLDESVLKSGVTGKYWNFRKLEVSSVDEHKEDKSSGNNSASEDSAT